MLTVSQTLPDNCLLGHQGRALEAALARSGGLWFTADADDVLVEGDVITGWRARVGGVTMRAAAPNQGGTQFDIDRPAFVFRSGINGGFTLPDASPKANCFTAAVIFATPEDEARTLVSVKTGAANDMIFLSEADGQIFAKDREGAVAAVLPSPRRHGQWRMAIVSYTGRALHLWADGASAVGQGRASWLDQPADLFVGCRSNRSGLVKTLGASRLRDVMFWHGRALLAEDDSGALAALQRYFRWTAL